MNTGLLDFRTDRDASLKLIDWFDIERVRSARILVIGAGAIGNEVLKNLALLGIGHVFIYDKDTIDMSNLSRSVLFRASDAGSLKAAVAARAIRDLNPNVEALWEAGDVTLDLGLGVYRTMDVIIGCLDNREARLHVNRACWKLRLSGFYPDPGVRFIVHLDYNGHEIIFLRPTSRDSATK